MIRCKTATRLAIIFPALVAAILAGCAATTPAVPEAAVKARAQQRWQALVSGDVPKAYGMMAPGFRAVTSLDRFRSGLGTSVQWLGAEVVGVKCEADKCAANVRLDARPLIGMRPGSQFSTHMEETWILEDGQWWFFQKL